MILKVFLDLEIFMKFFVLILVVLTLFTGCINGLTSIEHILEPPKLSEQQSEIYQALINNVGDTIKLQYPKTGSNRSAFVLSNIDRDHLEEAIVFYTQKGYSKNVDLRINILDYRDGRWFSVYDMPSGSSQIDKISFFRDHDQNFIMIGFSVLDQVDKVFKIFKFDSGILKEVFSQTYSIFEVLDLDHDNNDEILFVSKDMSYENIQDRFTAKLLDYENGKFIVRSEVLLNPSISYYSNLEYGFISQGTKAIFLDGLKGQNVLSTQIILIDQLKSMKNMSYNEDNSNIFNTDRITNVFSKDIDNDNIIEIPSQVIMNGYEDEKDKDRIYLTNWNRYNPQSNSLDLFRSSYVNTIEGYNFTLPDRWKGKITAKRIIENNEIVFYEFKGSIQNSTEEILRIRTMSRRLLNEVYELIEDQGYFEALSSGQVIYMIKIPDTLNQDLKITHEELSNLFNLYR